MSRGRHRHHPWRRFRTLVEWSLHFAHLPDGVLGLTDHERRTVTLTHGLTQAERRSTIAHETAHVERGPVMSRYREREERAVNAIAARRLVTLDELADAMVWSLDDHEIAEECWVDVDTVRTRLANLTASERAWVEQRLDDAGA